MDVIVTVDTEADGAWDADGSVEVKNLDFIPRFQHLCETYELEVGLACRLDDRLERDGRSARLRPCKPPRRGGLDHDDRDAVRDDVVELLSDPHPFAAHRLEREKRA